MVSQNAERAANDFIVKIRKGIIKKDTLPNSFKDYTVHHEKPDLESYRKFIKTLTYDKYVYDREVKYYGD